MDQEHDVCIIFFFDYALESVVTVSRISAAQSLANQFGSRDNTVGYFYSRIVTSFFPTLALNSKYNSDLAISGT